MSNTERFVSLFGRALKRLSDASAPRDRACGHGNVDHRVLRCTSELLVIATDNEI